MNDFGFDINNTPDLETRDYTIVDGTHPMVIEKVQKVLFENGTKEELSSNDNNPNAVIEFRFQIIDGQCKGLKYNTIFNVNSENETAQQIARSTIKAIINATGIDMSQATFSDLEGKMLNVELRSTPSKKDPSKTYQNIRKVSSFGAMENAVRQAFQTPVQKQDKPSWGM